MIVCHCNAIAERDIEATIEELLAEDPWRLLVPGQVYHEMGKRGRCCGCFPGVIDIIIRTTENFHRRNATCETEIGSLTSRLRQEHERSRNRRSEAARYRRRGSRAA